MGACSSILKQIIVVAANEVAQQQEESKPTSQQPSKPSSQHHEEFQPSSQKVSSGDAVYSNLPANAEKVAVRNVYDGDTLTLQNEDRVRFVGIDTPEIKENEPFAVEAKEYTKSRCNKGDLYLVQSGGRDKFDRILAYAYVQQDDGSFLCLNEGLVASGLAVAYSPSVSERPDNWDKLLSLQSRAREKGLGRWSQFKDRDVVKTANGSAYHSRSCEHLSSVRNLTEMKESEAIEKGLHPCRSCLTLG
ncbi:hypothetical protein FisN_10Lh118 [Fistulifera solaris]|uniref:TNase-like domain-containing protein n=1 Tax=Fistulifera solaris TaxID=1519565 RepID=A0A1Z5JTB7_FISSO|nr:hypothetical protein FisN_10Lh118 [Fistulifera solaris]|eukprot:GAX17260.1 hypothetical protein FisN_10Lh118 [Fistulifera solaris]